MTCAIMPQPTTPTLRRSATCRPFARFTGRPKKPKQTTIAQPISKYARTLPLTPSTTVSWYNRQNGQLGDALEPDWSTAGQRRGRGGPAGAAGWTGGRRLLAGAGRAVLHDAAGRP